MRYWITAVIFAAIDTVMQNVMHTAPFSALVHYFIGVLAGYALLSASQKGR